MIDYDYVMAYESKFEKGRFFRSSGDTLNHDFHAAIDTVRAAGMRDLERAARTHEGRVFAALDFLMQCRWQLDAMEDIAKVVAEVEADKTAEEPAPFPFVHMISSDAAE